MDRQENGGLTRKERLRRVARLCCHCLKNLAYYKTGWHTSTDLFKEDQFWKIANNNFLDICVLEWCKLFGEPKGQYSWRKIVTDPQTFFGSLLKELKITEMDFNTYVKGIRIYRDKFVAHLDSERVMNIPKLALAQQSVCYLYDYLLANEDQGNFFPDAPSKAATFYECCFKEGIAVWSCPVNSH